MKISRCSAAILGAFLVFLFIIQALLIVLLMWQICDNKGSSSVVTDNNSNTKTSGPVGEWGPWENIRLPVNLIPISYNVSVRPIIHVEDETRNAVYGSLSVTYLCKIPTKHILLHSLNINFNLADVSLMTAGCNIKIRNLTFYEPNQYVVFQTKYPCEKGENYTLSISQYVGTLSSDLWGLYRSTYETEDGQQRAIVSTHMEPTGARKIFPCFDEPGYKAKFTMTLWFRPIDDYFAVANMPAIEHKNETINGKLWNATTFEETYPMSTYTLAFAVCDYSYVESFSKSGVRVRTYAPKEQIDNGTANYASEVAPNILENLQNYFGVEYPIEKADQIVAPQLVFGAMENWGLVVYRKEILLVDNDATIHEKMRSTNVIAHELVHMWFGNLVTPTFWNDIWLNEGFATYFSYFGVESVRPTWNSKHLFYLEDYYSAMEADEVTSSHPIINYATTPDDIFQMFDIITYKKGASLLRMINGFLGDKLFLNGIKDYLTELSYETATTEKLFEYWDKQVNYEKEVTYPESISKMMTPWTTRSGFPLLNIKKEDDGYLVTQERFLKDEGWAYTKSSWYVPLPYKVLESKTMESNKLTWLLPNKELKIDEEQLILANVDATGFYRINYDEQTWEKIIQYMKSEKVKEISTESRGQLISDSFTMAMSGRLNITIPLKLSEYLLNETDFVPWRIFTNNIEYLERLLIRSSIYPEFKNYVEKLAEQLYTAYGFKDDLSLEDSKLFEKLNIQLSTKTSCHYGCKRCSEKADTMYKEWMETNSRTIFGNMSETLRQQVYCTAIRNGGWDEWNFALKEHSNTQDKKERSLLRFGLSCSRDSTKLWILLVRCYDEDILISGESWWPTCMKFIIDNEYGRHIAWKYFSEVQGIRHSSFLDYLTKTFSSKEEIDSLTELKERSEKNGNPQPGIENAIAKAKKNFEWRKQNEEDIKNWLMNRNV